MKDLRRFLASLLDPETANIRQDLRRLRSLALGWRERAKCVDTAQGQELKTCAEQLLFALRKYES